MSSNSFLGAQDDGQSVSFSTNLERRGICVSIDWSARCMSYYLTRKRKENEPISFLLARTELVCGKSASRKHRFIFFSICVWIEIGRGGRGGEVSLVLNSNSTIQGNAWARNGFESYSQTDSSFALDADLKESNPIHWLLSLPIQWNLGRWLVVSLFASV